MGVESSGPSWLLHRESCEELSLWPSDHFMRNRSSRSWFHSPATSLWLAMWHVHMVFKGWKEVDLVVQREIQKAEAKAKTKGKKTGWGQHMKVFSFSPPGLLSQCWHTRVAVFLSTSLKGSDWVGNRTALEDIKHSASLWSYPGASSWVLCFCSPVCHICWWSPVCFRHSVTCSTKERGCWIENDHPFQ